MLNKSSYQVGGNVSAAPHPGSSDFKIWLLAVDAVDGKGELLEMWVSSLQESVAIVAERQEAFPFVFGFQILDLPKGPAFCVEVLPKPFKLSFEILGR